MQDETKLQQLEVKYRSLVSLMDERMRRQWAATEARAYGWGGVRAVSGVIGMSANTISRGLAELAAREKDPDGLLDTHLRRKGGGRKRRSEADPELVETLERLVEPLTRGDPESPLRWTCKSTTRLAMELTQQGHAVSPHPELARSAVGESRCHHPFDRQHDHSGRLENTGRIGFRTVSHGHQSLRCRTGRSEYEAGQLSRRLELHALASTQE